MTEARIERVYVDRVSAGEFLEQAEGFLADADAAGLPPPSRAVLLHNATVCACDAILQAAGLRVTSGDRAHVLRLQTALDQVDADTEDLLESLDATRERRNEASYAAAFVPESSVVEAREAAAELLALATVIVRG